LARDHRKLRVFQNAHELVLAIYRQTRTFPRDEWFGMRLQMRKAATSIPTNIVEGCARRTTSEYLSFVNIARGSAGELHYLIDLASELGYLAGAVFKDLNLRAEQVVRQLERLLQELLLKAEREQRSAKKRQLRASTTALALSPEPGRPETWVTN
jgi:four helix bundle protein